MGGGFFLGGGAQSGYNLPGSVFDSEFRCTFALLDAVPWQAIRRYSVKDEFFTFNEQSPVRRPGATSSIANGRIVHGPRFGLSWRDGFDLARLALTPEAKAGGAAHRGLLFPAVLLDRILVAATRRSWDRSRNTARRSCGATSIARCTCSPTFRTWRTSGARRSTSIRRLSNRWSLGCARAA